MHAIKPFSYINPHFQNKSIVDLFDQLRFTKAVSADTNRCIFLLQRQVEYTQENPIFNTALCEVRRLYLGHKCGEHA